MRKTFVRNAPFYALAAVLCAATYMLLQQDIALSLLPHKVALELLFDFRFVFVEGLGYAQAQGLFVIARSCMGVKLFINLYLIQVFGFLHRKAGPRAKITAMAEYYALAFVLAFAVTVARIAASVPFCGWEHFTRIHNALSLALYFIAGLALYLVMSCRLTEKM